jgi:hypothetical protein
LASRWLSAKRLLCLANQLSLPFFPQMVTFVAQIITSLKAQMRERFSARHAASDPSLTVDRFRAFASQGAVFSVRLVGLAGGFGVLVQLKTGVFWLHTEKSQKRRVFSRAETAFKLVKEVGMKELAGVDLAGWVPDLAPQRQVRKGTLS